MTVGIKARTTKYPINKSFFKSWSQEVAWIYGWFLGDATFTEPMRIRIELARDSAEVLQKFRKILGPEHPIKNRERRNSSFSYIQFYSVELHNDFQKLSYLDIPNEYLPDFIRGFFEAEGTIRWCKSKIIKRGGAIRLCFSQNDQQILEFIHSTLLSQDVVKKGFISKNGGNSLLLEFGIADSISIYPYLYDNCGALYSPRKKQKFEELIERQLA